MSLQQYLPATSERVTVNTADHVNRRIREGIEDRLTYFANHPDEIERRLRELDYEWDIERTLEANAATVSLLGLALAIAVDRRWLALPVTVAAFLLQHAVQGWCPPVPVFRRQGVRTANEIDHERYALKYLRGDFGNKPSAKESARERAREALESAEA
jgi:sirohydrochlorin ferrochelatase